MCPHNSSVVVSVRRRGRRLDRSAPAAIDPPAVSIFVTLFWRLLRVGADQLAAYGDEYLVISGATKTAEVFKEEVLSNVPNGAIKPSEVGPGFLQNWWMLFWDLYCAAPERRDGPDGQSTQEAKAFHDFGFVPGGFGPPGPMMNGMHAPGVLWCSSSLIAHVICSLHEFSGFFLLLFLPASRRGFEEAIGCISG
ncbi:hypothetical protein ANCDUO_06129 [Ancylostoma duodenale]|uniref:Uncharacterized protein n=1 Tax=Ancylostoma duodenale TaxID=51022 RepID=A0A0C2H2B5_9BILA|nr:hypothetical protein ANCDUO_06129 [Ancylostoma duodenale]